MKLLRKKPIVAVVLVALIAVAGVLVQRVAFAKETTAYRFATVEQGDIQQSVSATGTLGAVRTVSVGTQVSGQISELLADFNDEVKKGQLLARVDPTLAQQSVSDAQASVERAQAQLRQAQRDHSRNNELLASGLVARSAFDASESSLDVAQANVKSARVSLDRARQNLGYTNIYAPIDGVVVERNVDSGQTVAASLSAPQLFLIANDLTNMQILANVGESDIASIKEGQKVRFTVQALTGQKFDGTVQQVRLQSVTQENVVNYTVVVSVMNPEKKLLPGMTARVEFLVQTADDVLKVPNAALRFKPETAAVAAVTETGVAPASSRPRSGQQGPRAGRQDAGGTRPRPGTLYVLDAKGTPQAIRVRTGITDGTVTEVRGTDLKDGMKVITGTSQAASTDTAAASGPFTSGQTQTNRRPGGF